MRDVNSSSDVENVLDTVGSLHRVEVFLVHAGDENFFLRRLEDTPQTSGFALRLRCDCEGFWQTGDLCEHSIAAADDLGVISMDTMLTELAPRRPAGRPRKHHGDCRARDGGSGPSGAGRAPLNSVAWFHKQITHNAPLYYYKWRVARTFSWDDERVYIGFVSGFRHRKLPRGQGLEKLWIIHYPDHPEDPKEEITASELAQALCDAQRMGVQGPSPP